MLLALPILLLAGQADLLANLEKLSQESKPGTDWVKNLEVGRKLNDGVIQLIASNNLKPEEFERASQLVRPGGNDFRAAQMRYELCLAALASGRSEAGKTIAGKWDEFLVSMSRPRRIGTFVAPGELYRVVPSVKSVVDVLKKPEESRKTAATKSDHPEIKKIVDADQADRKLDFSKLSQKEMMDIGHRDEARLKRTHELLRKGEAKTAQDFANAALVLQHGQVFGDYALAHELCVASMILGNVKAAWLSGASYDRMLSHSGHPQRFTTQYQMGPSGYELSWYDPERINDAIRTAVVKVTLEQAKNRKWD